MIIPATLSKTDRQCNRTNIRNCGIKDKDDVELRGKQYIWEIFRRLNRIL